MSLCPDKPILAGFSRSFAPYPFSTLEGCYDGDVICLARLPVNNPNPHAVRMCCERRALSQKTEGYETILYYYQNLPCFSAENVALHLPLEAGTRDERRMLAVGSSAFVRPRVVRPQTWCMA